MFAASVNAKHIHTSAKNNEGIDNLFETLTNSILAKHSKPDSAPTRFHLLLSILVLIELFLGKI